MGENRTDSFVFYRTYYNSIMRLDSDSDKVELLKCFCLYAFDGEFYESKTDYINSIFEANRFNIDKAFERRKINQENGSKGGAPAGNQNAKKQPKTTEINRSEPRNNLNVNADAYGDVYGKENVYLNGKGDLYEDRKDNGIVKGRRKERGNNKKQTVRNLMSSDLDSLFPDEEINDVSAYYTELKNNEFTSKISFSEIKTIDELKEDYRLYKEQG